MNMRTIKIIIASIILFLLFYSYQFFFGQQAGTEVIKIVGVDSVGDLILKDAKDKPAKIFEVPAGTKIKWQIKTDEVDSIVNIYKKTTITSDDIFSYGPEPDKKTKDWDATVDPTAKEKQFIEYNIDWTDKDGKKHTYDPRIQVKS